MNQTIIDVLGWTGTISYLVAYYLISTKKIEGDAVSYQLINLFGGVLLTMNAVFHGAMPAVAVNAAWVGISIFYWAVPGFHENNFIFINLWLN
ncbi:MAG: hypothetical protein M1282_09305 [Chloroflexi bacterium]|nr:hypothetical protein [Chloroflexota bacterium]